MHCHTVYGIETFVLAEEALKIPMDYVHCHTVYGIETHSNPFLLFLIMTHYVHCHTVYGIETTFASAFLTEITALRALSYRLRY